MRTIKKDLKMISYLTRTYAYLVGKSIGQQSSIAEFGGRGGLNIE